MSKRICILHQNFQVTHICNKKDCKLQRWCCVQCIKLGIHSHNQREYTYVIEQQELRINKLELVQKFSKNASLPEGLKQSKQLLRLVQEYQLSFEQLVEKNQKDKGILQKLISDLSEENFIRLDDKRIDEIIKTNFNQFCYEKLLMEPIQIINQNVNYLHTTIKNYQENLHLISDSFERKQRRYTLQQIDQTNKTYCSSVISNNEQYLAYSDENKMLKIYDIKNAKIIKQIKVDQCIYFSQFTSDSAQLYVGGDKGHVHGYDALNNFKLIFSQQVHEKSIRNLRIIKDTYLITASIDCLIKKTDIKRKKQIFKLVGQKSFMFAMDYNEIDDMILTGSFDKSIKLLNCNDKSLIIDKKQSHPSDIHQIQFVDRYKNVLSLDYKCNLYKWRINLHEKALIKIQEISDPNQIQNFCQINQNQNLLLICEDYFKILNQQGKTIYILKNKDYCNVQNNYVSNTIIESRQLDSGRYIILRQNSNRIFLAMAY